jgi:hypothetical protein
MLIVRLILQMSRARVGAQPPQRGLRRSVWQAVSLRLAQQPQVDRGVLEPRISQENRRQQGPEYVYGETNSQAYRLPIKNIAQDDA